jgi:hypothetical protein
VRTPPRHEQQAQLDKQWCVVLETPLPLHPTLTLLGARRHSIPPISRMYGYLSAVASERVASAHAERGGGGGERAGSGRGRRFGGTSDRTRT